VPDLLATIRPDAISIALFLEAAREGRLWAWAGAGAAGGLSIYFYPQGRLWGALAIVLCLYYFVRLGTGRRINIVAGSFAAGLAALYVPTYVELSRTLWREDLIREGSGLVAATLPRARLGPYQLQAAIAAVHADAATPGETDWPQVLALYELLERVAPNPMVTLNRAVALAMVRGPQAGLELIATLEDDERIARHHRLASVRAHLLELAGDTAAAREAFKLAARLTTSVPEQQYLTQRAARLSSPAPDPQH